MEEMQEKMIGALIDACARLWIHSLKTISTLSFLFTFLSWNVWEGKILNISAFLAAWVSHMAQFWLARGKQKFLEKTSLSEEESKSCRRISITFSPPAPWNIDVTPGSFTGQLVILNMKTETLGEGRGKMLCPDDIMCMYLPWTKDSILLLWEKDRLFISKE